MNLLKKQMLFMLQNKNKKTEKKITSHDQYITTNDLVKFQAQYLMKD